MAERSGFFPYVAGDANSEYDSAWLAKYIASFIGNGTYNGDLAVTADGSAMSVTLPSGRAWINGYHYRNDGNLTLAIDNADGVLNRKDIVVLRWDINARSITARVVKGTPASTAAAPEITRDAEQYDLKLAEISIPAGTTAITQSLIIDTRLDDTVCGIVTGVVQQVDTTTFYNQIAADLAAFKGTEQADFSAWFDEIKGILGTDEAGNLLNLINGLAGSGRTTETVKGNADAISAILDSKGQPNGIATLDANKQLVQDAKTLNGHGTDNGPNSVLLSGRKEGTTIGTNSTAEGFQTEASGLYSHAEGYYTQASKQDSHAEGHYTQAIGNFSHAEGDSTTASGGSSHAEGLNTTASGSYSHAEGHSTTASGDGSHAEGHSTTADVYLSHAQGRYNKALAGDPENYSATADAMVIGNGTGSRTLSNCFRVTFSGNVYGLSSYHSSGADYSEFFEWLDENPNKEDRVGHFVTLDGEKIKYANDGDYIVGIVSGAPAIIGDHPSESWSERWVKDVFGRIQTEEVDIPETQEKDKDGNVIRTIPEHTETHFKVNPDYDPAKEAEYANREKRPEWATVGMLGKLVVIDDGTCEVNGYCKPMNGTATKSDTGYRVLARLDETHIKVLMK